MKHAFFAPLMPISVLLLACVPWLNADEGTSEMKDHVEWRASWIWASGDAQGAYNEFIEARKSFELPTFSEAMLRIAADTRYRLYVNGAWVNDGPSRAWPHHYQYDVVDVGAYLRPGANEVRVIARFYGIGTFHQLPQEPGLLAQLNVTAASGETIVVGTDASWEVRRASQWFQFAPKQSVQMGPFELYDARREGETAYEAAAVLYAAGDGPWQGLEARDCPLLTKIPFAPRTFEGASALRRTGARTFILPTAHFLYDGVVYANIRTAMTGAYAVLADLPEGGTLTADADGNTVLVEGRRAPKNVFELKPGVHLLYCVLSETWGHWRHDTEIRLLADKPMRLRNPMNDEEDAPWCFVPFTGDVRYALADYAWPLLPAEERDAVVERFREQVKQCIASAPDASTFREKAGASVRLVAADEFMESPHYLFTQRAPLDAVAVGVDNPEGLFSGTGETVVHPSAEGDVELIYDLGEQNIGYYEFEIEAEAGLILDIFGVEYITPEGVVQHTGRYRNGMRYICREGKNVFQSYMRRSQRYVFITLRNQTRPAAFSRFSLIESTYPVQPVGRFQCSDDGLNRIWEISARTLKLCMEDTFTDCPLYEQTLWVGDARNEALFGYTAFGSADIARRCIRLAAFSLDKHPLVQSQVPSTWETLLPAWSFLWGIMVWDYYEYTGDRALLEWVYPYVVKNLRNAAAYTDERGLFSGPFWNMFDWSGIDDGHNSVTHNSMFVVGAAEAALKCADALGDKEHRDWLKAYRDKTVSAVNALWLDDRMTYPDSVHNDGAVSSRVSIHNAFLALLYDAAPEERREALIAHLLNPPEDMTRVGSPFAILYLFEALEKVGLADEVIARIREAYQPMLDLDATTVWESFAHGSTGDDVFPTRSHTHAWSSAPVYFLNRILLGIAPEAPGGAAFVVSPRPNGLEWAEGASACNGGAVAVSWKRVGDRIDITASAPEGVGLRFAFNDALAGLEVHFNGVRQEAASAP